MAYGMTYEQYWFGDPWMVRAYAQSYLLKRKVDNEIAWIHGAYVYNALNASIGTAFSKRKINYIEKPVDFFPKTEWELEREKRQKKKQLVKFLSSMIKPKRQNTGVDQDGKS